NQQSEEAQAFFSAPFQPQEIGRSVAILAPEGGSRAQAISIPQKLFLANCANCHGTNAAGGALGPSLVDLAGRRHLPVAERRGWIAGHGREVSGDSMPGFKQLSADQIWELAEWLLSLDKPLANGGSKRPTWLDSDPPAAYAANCA